MIPQITAFLKLGPWLSVDLTDKNITTIENSQLMIKDAYLFRCCCLVAPRLFTFCALFCRFILK